jgi:hypothetical protein
MDQLPQKGGRFYTLAKEFDKQAQPKLGDNNWLSDAIPNTNYESNLSSRSIQQLRNR